MPGINVIDVVFFEINMCNKKGDKQAAELLTSMYDASLDAFAPSYWSFYIYNSFYTRYNARFNSDLKVTDKLDIKGTLAYSNVNSNRIQTGSNLSGLLLGLYRTPADFDQRDYKGTKYSALGIPNFNSQR